MTEDQTRASDNGSRGAPGAVDDGGDGGDGGDDGDDGEGAPPSTQTPPGGTTTDAGAAPASPSDGSGAIQGDQDHAPPRAAAAETAPRQRSGASPTAPVLPEQHEPEGHAPEGHAPECPPVSEPSVPARAWQVQVLAAVDRCRSDLTRTGGYDRRQVCLRTHVDADLTAAVAATGPSTRGPWLSDAWSGRRVETAWAAVHHVRAVLPLLCDDEALPAHQLDARRLTTLYLDTKDPRRVAVESDLLSLRLTGRQPSDGASGADPVKASATRRDRETVSHAIAAAYDENDQRYASLRGWRNRVYVAAGLSALVLVLLVLILELSGRGPDLVPLGSVGTEDVSALMVVLLGSLAAFVTAVVATRSSGPTSSAYSLTPALASLRVPLGGLTALLGVLLLRSTTVPGLSAPDTVGETAAASLLFGASQELFTRLIDARARKVEELAVNGGSSASAT